MRSNVTICALLLPVTLLTYSVLLAQHHNIHPETAQAAPLSSRMRFDRIPVEQGLSNSFVQCIIQDKRGYMWFGTQEGLNKYDGYKFTVYESGVSDSNTISNNDIRAICQDRSGDLWIGTDGGLNRFDPAMERFTRYSHDPHRPTSLGSNTVLSIIEDGDGILWIGTDNGLDMFDKAIETFTHFRLDPQNSKSISHNYVGVVYEDRFGTLWVGTGFLYLGGGGLNRFDKHNKTFTHYMPDSKNPGSLNNIWVTAIAEDASGVLWVGTDSGLEEFDRESNTFTHYAFKVGASWKSIRKNNVKSIRGDRSGKLWIGTWQDGLFRLDKSTGEFTRCLNNPSDPKSISSNFPQCIYEDRSGIFWIGTVGAGVNKFQPVTKTFTHIKFEDPAHVGPALNDVRSFYEDRSGALWVGTMWGLYIVQLQSGRVVPAFVGDQYINAICGDKADVLWLGTGNGMFKFDKRRKKISHFYEVETFTASPQGGDISTLLMDRSGKLWIGAMNFLAVMDSTSETLKHYKYSPQNKGSLSNDHVQSMLQDRSGTLWVGTTSGLNRFVPETESFARYEHDPQDLHSLSNNDVRTIFEDHSGVLWIGTSDGLNSYDRARETFSRVTKNTGIRNNVINGILEDSHGNLWISTNKGLSKFNPEQKTVRNYDVLDGLQGDEFNLAASFRDEGGEMFFGGVNGLTVFHPDSIHDNLTIPPVVITDFRLFNEEVSIGHDSPLRESISGARMVHLTYDQNSFSFEFASLDYTAPAKNQYAYKFEDIDKDWVQSSTRRFVSYANCPPGTYVFHVKASNNDRIWNEQGASVLVIITPPWWSTTWAYIGYVLVLGTVLLSGFRYEGNRQRLKHEARLRSVEAEKLKEINQLKSRFFANLSHEFRTPLSLILGPTEQLESTEREISRKEQLGLIRRNAERLLRMVNQLLQFARIESGTIKLHVSLQPIPPLLWRIVSSFSTAAVKKGIALNVEIEPDAFQGFVDAEKVEHIVENLLSNAMKYTNSGGTIGLHARRIGTNLTIVVADSGVGIEQEHLAHVFDRFYRVDASHQTEGTGIGLSLTKELVELHHGSIRLTSDKGRGTTVAVTLPLSAYAESEIGQPPDVAKVHRAEKEANAQPPVYLHPADHQEKLLVLVVEDNEDARAYLRTRLEPEFEVMEAGTGLLAVQRAQERVPDIVVSDVMMPEMNGYELCRELKTDVRTSHIPVILLTALAEQTDRIVGLETGADDYLVKPIDAHELVVRVRNLIANRKKVQDRFRTVAPLKPGEVRVESLDDAFLRKAIEAVEQRVSDDRFDVEQFAKAVFLSRAQLHRKIKALTNLSATDFIRHLRLQRAKELLEKNAGTVGEIAYRVGFTNHSYFSQAFKEQFGTTPAEILRR